MKLADIEKHISTTPPIVYKASCLHPLNHLKLLNALSARWHLNAPLLLSAEDIADHL